MSARDFNLSTAFSLTVFGLIKNLTEELYFMDAYTKPNLLLHIKNNVMGRVFTVSFNFKEQPCTALVSLNDRDGYNPAFSVHYLSKEVENIIPERKVVFSLVNGIEDPRTLHDKLAEELVEKTSEAITQYLSIHA
jgi:hypothetical protein